MNRMGQERSLIKIREGQGRPRESVLLFQWKRIRVRSQRKYRSMCVQCPCTTSAESSVLLWDHHFPPPALPQTLVCAKPPLPLCSSKLQALCPWLPKSVPGWMYLSFDVSFHWITEEGEGLLSEGWL